MRKKATGEYKDTIKYNFKKEYIQRCKCTRY